MEAIPNTIKRPYYGIIYAFAISHVNKYLYLFYNCRRTRGSRRSEDLAPSTPSNTRSPLGSGRTTPNQQQSRVKNCNQLCSINHTPTSQRPGANGKLIIVFVQSKIQLIKNGFLLFLVQFNM